MNRRKFLDGFGKFMTITPPLVSSKVLAAGAISRSRKDGAYYLIFDSNSLGSYQKAQDILSYLAQRPGFDSSVYSQIETLDVIADELKFLDLKKKHSDGVSTLKLPAVISIPYPDSKEVEIWDERWLNWNRKSIDDACYPVSGGWWSVEGDWDPTIEKVRNHLFHSPNHTDGHFFEDYLARLQFEELQSLHSDHHREMTGRGSVHWLSVNVECPVESYP